MSKIPCTCRFCGNELLKIDMDKYLAQCEHEGVDPIATALALDPPGVYCTTCLARIVGDAVEDGDPRAKMLLNRYKLNARGMRIVK